MRLNLICVLSFVGCIAGLTTGCESTVDSDAYVVLPRAAELVDLPPATKATLRVEAEIPGSLSKSPLMLDLSLGYARGKFTLPEADYADVQIVLSFYGAKDATTQEVLLGRVEHTASIVRGESNRVTIPEFETTGPLFDSNRNDESNLDDLIAGYDPAPMVNPIDVSPQTISFESGVEVGGFTRSFFVLENNGDESVSLDLAVRLASGVTIAPLEQIFEIGSEAPTDNYSIVDLAPGEEQVMAITFAPSNALFVAGALSVNSITKKSEVRHALMMRLIGNPEGAVPQPPASYSIPDPSDDLTIDTYDGPIKSYKVSKLFSREPDEADSIEEHKKADGETDGMIGGQDVDEAYLVVVPPGYRFSLTLDGLNNDVDLFLFKANPTFDADGVMTALDPVAFESETTLGCAAGLTITPVDCSTNSGVSAEAVAFDGTQERDDSTYLVIALDRPTLPPGQEDALEETPAGAATEDDTQEPSVQAAMYSLPEIDFVESSSACPDDGYGESACTEANGGSNVTILGVNFEVGLTVQVTWTDQVTGSDETQLAVCSNPEKGASVDRPVLDEDGKPSLTPEGVPVVQTIIRDRVVCVSPPAGMSPQLAPKANLVLRNPNGAVATRPQALTYLPPPPEVDNVSPLRGPTTGGSTVTIYGESFYEINGRLPSVIFGDYVPGEIDTNANYVIAEVRELSEDGTELVVELPSCFACQNNGFHDVTVINPDLRRDTLGGIFEYFQPDGPDPIIYEVTPSEGSTLGSDSTGAASADEGRGAVTIRGKNFYDSDGLPVERLLVDNQEVWDFTVTQAATTTDFDELVVNMPSHEAGPVAIEVVNSRGQTDRKDGLYTYRLPEPEFEAMLPAQGLVSGNTVAVITGRYFQPGVRVFFGTIESGQVAFNSQSSLTVVVPPLPSTLEAGPVDIILQNLDLTGVTAANAFTYIDPTLPEPVISEIAVTSGPIEGGTAVTIQGEFFQNGVRVLFGNTSALSVEYRSPQELVALAPPHEPGVVGIMVENPDGQSYMRLEGFTYFIPAPAIAGLTPTSGPVGGGTTVLIAGSGFQVGATVQFSNSASMDADVYSSNLISCITPAGSEGFASVTVTNPAIGFETPLSVTREDGFTFIEPVEDPPRIFGLEPDNGSSQGGTPVTIKGTGFEGVGSEVYFGPTQVSIISYSLSGLSGGLEDTLTVIAPPHNVGGETVKVQNEDGQADWTTFNYTANPPQLSLTGVVPSAGDSKVNSSVLILGQGFKLDSTVTLSGAFETSPDPDGCPGAEPEELTCDYIIENPIWISSSLLSTVIPLSCHNLADPCINVSGYTLDLTVSNPSTGHSSYMPTAFSYSQILNTLVLVTELGVGSLECPVGGQRVATGKDTNGNGSLENGEINDISLSCYGANTLVLVSEGVAEDSSCAVQGLSGMTVCHGLDDNGDGSFEGEESTCVSLCDGAVGEPGDQGSAGVNALVSVVRQDEIGFCDGTSGLKIQTGQDTDNNGELDPGEPVSIEYFVCDGVNGTDGVDGSDGLAALVEVTEYDGELCLNAGQKVMSGYDTNGVAGLQDTADGEVEADTNVNVSYLCTPAPGLTSLIDIVDVESSETGDCGLAGGYKITSGLDISGDGSLEDEAAEDLIIRNICNGSPGVNGFDGLTALVNPTVLDPGDLCPYGGHQLLTGLDSNQDGVLTLDDEPEPSSSHICDGAPGVRGYAGLGVPLELLPGEEGCVNGGVRVDYGWDVDSDRDLDENDIAIGFYTLCNGEDGINGGDGADGVSVVVDIESLVAGESETCTAFGGIEIRIGYDEDGDQIMDDDPTQVQMICHGEQGDASLLMTETLEPGEICVSGGHVVYSGLDTNGEAGLQPAEYLHSWSVCHGVDGISILAEITVENSGGNCTYGGNKLILAGDYNGNGSIDDGEEIETSYLCNGADGLNVLVETGPITTSPQCPQGGIEIKTGQDDDASGVLSEAEVDSSQWICEGNDSLISAEPLAEDPAVCATGGVLVRVGRDLDASGVLDNTEVTGQQAICNGPVGAAGLSSLIKTTPVTGEPCSVAGFKVETGVDSDGDGILSEAEVATVDHVCQGEDGSSALVSSAPVGPSEECPLGGFEVTSGVDANNNGVADEGETSSFTICNAGQGTPGLNSLVLVSEEMPGDQCVTGGQKLETGLDANNNGTFEQDENPTVTYICNGATGTHAMVNVVEAGDACATGGFNIYYGVDADANGNLDEAEWSVATVCNGVQGTPGLNNLILVSEESPGAQCVTGGQKVETGLDANNNGTLEQDENPTVTYICNGATGTHAMVDVVEAGDACATGGFNIYYGVDADANGNLDETEWSVATVCNGVEGATGAASLIVLEVDSQNCASGGVVVHSGVDTNANGSLDVPGEVVSSQSLCNGPAGMNSLMNTVAEQEGDNCAFGGYAISTGLDDGAGGAVAGNGTLEAGEVDQVFYVCHGESYDDALSGPVIAFITPSTVRPEMGGAVVIHGSNFAPNAGEASSVVTISGASLVIQQDYSSTTQLSVVVPPITLAPVSARQAGDRIGGVPLILTVENDDGQSDYGVAYYAEAECFDDGSGHCEDGYICSNNVSMEASNGGQPSGGHCEWACDSDFMLEETETCLNVAKGWELNCGVGTSCLGVSRAGSGFAFGYQGFLVNGGDGGGDDLVFVTYAQDGEILIRPVCTSSTCLNSAPARRRGHGFGGGDNISGYFLFGGQAMESGSLSDELWTLDSQYTQWSRLCGGDSGCSGPSARKDFVFTSFIPESPGNELNAGPTANEPLNAMVFGGEDANGIKLDDHWLWTKPEGANAASWQQLECGGACPSARSGAAFMAMNSSSFHMFGGQLWDGSYSDEFWSYSEDGWQLLCGGNSGCSGAPGVRDAGLTAGDSSSGEMGFYLMGGQGANGPSDALWLLEMNTATEAWQWSQACGTGTACSGPGNSVGAVLLGSGEGGIFLFGGENGSEITDQVWVYSSERVDGRGHTCHSLGYAGGALGCTNSCLFDISGCVAQPSCGDGVVQASAGEECDGSVPNNAQECRNFGVGSGAVTCGNDCRFDYSQCAYGYRCGNEVKDHPEEACDGDEDIISCSSVWQGIAGGAREGVNNISSSPGCDQDCKLRMDYCQQNPCGNGNVDTSYALSHYNVPQVVYSEACDPGILSPNFRGMTCEDFGMTGSTLSCTSQCEIDLKNCLPYASSCLNGLTDAGSETDTDCGRSCVSCINGKTCSDDSDCQSGRCAENICTANTCNDSLKNGKETDVDCGGPDCGGCIKSQACWIDEDCSVCTTAACTATYSNQNGFRATLCEGLVCKLSNETFTCSSNADCVSGLCDTQNSGRCLAHFQDDMCQSGDHEISLGNGMYECAEPSTAACNGQAESSDCAFASGNVGLNGKCYGGSCVATCDESAECSNSNSFCMPTGNIGDGSTVFVCIADDTFLTDNQCPTGSHEIDLGENGYRCVPPSNHECGGQHDGAGCSYTWGDIHLNGICVNGGCLASCGSAGLNDFYTPGSREVCTNTNSVCQPLGIIADSQTIGACLPTPLTCSVVGAATSPDASCPASSFGCGSAGQCMVPSKNGCQTVDAEGQQVTAPSGTACSVDSDLDGVEDANEAGRCVTTGQNSVCLPDCASNSCASSDSTDSNMSYCQHLEFVGMGAYKQFQTTGSIDGARADYKVCLTSDAACSSDADCSADAFVGCDSASHVCLTPSLTACASGDEPGSAAQGTQCGPTNENGALGYCAEMGEANGNGGTICLPSCMNAQGEADGAICTTANSTCKGVSTDGGIVYVCDAQGG